MTIATLDTVAPDRCEVFTLPGTLATRDGRRHVVGLLGVCGNFRGLSPVGDLLGRFVSLAGAVRRWIGVADVIRVADLDVNPFVVDAALDRVAAR
jgi:hypothetical protein